MPPITPVSTIPHPATISEALREIEQSEPRYLPYDTIDDGLPVSTPVNAANFYPPGTLELVEATETGVVLRYTDPLGTLDPSRWARVAGEVVPLPPLFAEAATDVVANVFSLSGRSGIDRLAELAEAEIATSLESEDDAE